VHKDNSEEIRQNNIPSMHHTPTIQISQQCPANQRHKHDYFHQSSSKSQCFHSHAPYHKKT